MVSSASPSPKFSERWNLTVMNPLTNTDTDLATVREDLCA